MKINCKKMKNQKMETYFNIKFKMKAKIFKIIKIFYWQRISINKKINQIIKYKIAIMIVFLCDIIESKLFQLLFIYLKFKW